MAKFDGAWTSDGSWLFLGLLEAITVWPAGVSAGQVGDLGQFLSETRGCGMLTGHNDHITVTPACVTWPGAAPGVQSPQFLSLLSLLTIWRWSPAMP